jgi:hypothetical protein
MVILVSNYSETLSLRGYGSGAASSARAQVQLVIFYACVAVRQILQSNTNLIVLLIL